MDQLHKNRERGSEIFEETILLLPCSRDVIIVYYLTYFFSLKIIIGPCLLLFEV